MNHFLGVERLPAAPGADAGLGGAADAAPGSGVSGVDAGPIVDLDGGGAAIANAAPFFAARVSRCQALYGRRANIVYVDDYEIGNTATAMQTLAAAPQP